MIARNPVREDQLFKWKKTQGYVFPMKPSEMFWNITNILQEWLWESLCCSHKVCSRTPPQYWGVVIFSDKTKIMLYYHDGPQRVYRKTQTVVENKNLIPTVKFGKLSVMVWRCISRKGVGIIRILNDVMTKDI